MIRWYQRAAAGRLSPCRFSPSCSSYAIEAFETHGTRRGAYLTLRRLVRCRPFGPSGWDPVPEPRVGARDSETSTCQTSTCQTSTRQTSTRQTSTRQTLTRQKGC